MRRRRIILIQWAGKLNENDSLGVREIYAETFGEGIRWKKDERESIMKYIGEKYEIS